VATLSTTTIKRGGDLKQTSTSTRLAAADLVLMPQSSFQMGILGTIASFILDGH